MADTTGDKKPKAKPKMMDVTRPKKAVSGDKPQIIITPRPMINRNISVTSPDDDTAQPSTASEPPSAPQVTTVKRPVIAPLNPIKVASAPPTPQSAAASSATTEPLPRNEASAPAPVSPVAAPQPTETETAAPTEPAKTEPIDNSNDNTTAAETDTAQSQAKQPNAQTRKAVEEAERAAKRKEELESYVSSKKFFVPINAVARKRSIKVSSLLTVFVFLLALVLVDLMVDSGFIFLVQKIPHTHFFASN